MKKFLTYSVVAATIAWSMGISAVLPAAAAYTPTDGDLIKTASYPAVYYVAGGKKYLFVNRVTFGTWRDDFTGLKTVTQSEFDAVPLGGNVTARAGVNLIKFDNSDLVYAVTPGAKLCKLVDTAAQTALYGSATPIIIQSSFEANYTKDATCDLTATSKYPNGALVKASGDASVYYIDGGMKRLVSSDAFTANGMKSSWVKTVADLSVYGTGAALTAKEDAVSSIVAGAGSGTVIGGSATVSLSADSPATTALITGQAGAVLAKFNFTGTGTVTGLKLKKIGIAGDTTLSNVYLYDGNTRLTDAGSVSNGIVSFSNPSGLFTISGSKVLTVKADILNSSGVSGQIVGIAINAASDVTGVTVGGTFPINGNTMSISYASDLATVALGTASNVGTTVTAGTSNVTLWSNSLTVGQRNVSLKSLTFKNIGSAPDNFATNVGLFVNGLKVSSASFVNGVVVFDMTSAPVTLVTGSSQVDVRGDVVAGTYRTFNLNLQVASDALLTDSSYGAGITVSGTLPSAPSTGATTISQGSISITTDPSFSTTQIVSNAAGQTLGKWIFKAYGEDMKVLSLKASTTATVSDTSQITASETINNYAIFVNGVQVGSSQTESMVTSTAVLTFGSGNLFTVAAGTSATVEVRGDLNFLSTSKINTLTTKLLVPANQIQGVVSYQTTPSSETYYSALNTLTIATGALTVNKNASYGDQTIAPNVVAQKVGSFVISNGDVDTVRVTNINIQLTSSTFGYATNTSDLYISENTGKVSPQSSNNFAVDFTLSPNQSKTIDVFLTIGNVSSDVLGCGVITSLSLTARTGANADASIGLTAAKKGQTITINQGSLGVVNPATSTAITARYVLGNTTVDKAAVFTVKATNAPIIIDEMAFHVMNSTAYYPVTALVVNGTTVNMVGNYATSTGMNLTIPATYAGTNITVKNVMNVVGQNANASNVMASTSLTYIKYHTAGGSPSTQYYTDGKIVGADITAVASIPSISVSKPSTLLSAGTVKLANVNLGADAAGPVNITTIALVMTSSSKVDVTSLVLKDAAGTSVSNSPTKVGSTNTATFTMSNGGYQVGAGTNQTLYLYGTVSASSAWGNAGTEYVTTALAAGSNFVWDDVNGNATGLTGAAIFGYSTDAISITN